MSIINPQMGHSLFIFGPAGAGKTTFCTNLNSHSQIINRNFSFINLDPSSIQNNDYILDIRDYISTTEIMEYQDLGPNGSLMHAFDLLYENIQEIDFDNYDFLVFDCPGQIELFMHSTSFKNIVTFINAMYKSCILYFVDGQSVLDLGKFMGNLLCGYICMSRFELSMFFILSKIDLIGKDTVCEFLENLESKVDANKLYKKIFEFAEVDFKMLDYDDEDSINEILDVVDCSVQYYDDVDVKTRDF